MTIPSWKHDDLAADLAQCRRDVGEIVAERLSLAEWGSSGIADVVSIRPSWSPAPTCWEIKISRADFLSDIRSQKWRKYRPFFARLYFATPIKLVDRREIPDGCGLTVRGPKGWRTVKAPHVERPATERVRDLYLALILNRHPAAWRPGRGERIERVAAEINRVNNGHRPMDSKATGQRVADALSDLARLRRHDKAFRALLSDHLGRDVADTVYSLGEVLAGRSVTVRPNEPRTFERTCGERAGGAGRGVGQD